MSQKACPYWPDKSIYFLIGSTFLHFPYFREAEQKQFFLNQIKKINKILNIPISAYSIAINHYHLKFYLEKGLDLAKVRQLLHGGTSFEYRKRFGTKYKEMWQSFKVIRVVGEEMDRKVTGYIIGNLLKHKEVSTFNELKENRFSSFWHTAEKYGEEYARGLVYKVIDVSEDAEGEVGVEEFKSIKI